MMKSNGYPIFNHGFVARKELSILYRACEFVVYPSLTESFGLGIIEAIENGCKIIGADLPYLRSVCQPSLTFNPNSALGIADAFEKSVKTETKKTKQLVFNDIKQLINLLR